VHGIEPDCALFFQGGDLSAEGVTEVLAYGTAVFVEPSK